MCDQRGAVFELRRRLSQRDRELNQPPVALDAGAIATDAQGRGPGDKAALYRQIGLT
jgi:hypothetical protein